ncbi:NADH-dependent flavin oxidoreductase [Cohnella algarum]|uniref:NADH-dependent flavin oxidoreductase n=1 Tax=Cohnella algarum TaxID=2044859 RepID=UPI0019674130|nr:NADH-dependent flavin oxidoreductase [Cohnella algarum]MBN2984595.1 NADH-dependent flavin oxidoreductase [Cohnella algarum]
MNAKFSSLMSPIALRSGIAVQNRIVMAPMTNFSSNEDGTVTDAEIAYYARRSKGVGMVVTACAYVTPNGKGFPGEFGADRDDMIPSLRRLASAIREQGAKAVLQIFHGGRACPPNLVPNGDVVSAGTVPAENGAVPRELTEDEAEAIVRDFGAAARRAIEAGFDGVEIHGANGYLIQQFYSPHTNRRNDRWGGDAEKRLAFPLAVVDAVKAAVREHAKRPFAVGYRFSPEEPEEPGLTMAETFRLIDALAEQSLDYLHVSLQEFWSAPRRGADASKPRIEWIVERAAGRVPVIGVGSIRTPDEAAKALRSGVEFVALGRELIVEPDWVTKVEEGREDDIRTTLTKDDQAELVVPDPLWQAIVNSPGWFPVVEPKR